MLLPEFSQQFPVLRSLTIDDLKGRFADQRARGSENRITEEEEDMILDALRFRSRGSNNAQPSQETLSPDDQPLPSSTNLTASPSGSSRSKRYSNNLFGSGRLRDYKYMRSKASLTGSTRSNSSVTPTESSVAAGRINSIAESTSTSSLRPMTPEGAASASISSIVSSLQTGLSPPQQEDESLAESSTSNISSSGYGAEESSISSGGMSTTSIECKLKTMDPGALKRASLALQAAIKELEDETEDEIVLPRSRTPYGVVNDLPDSNASYSSTEPGVAVAVSTADKHKPPGSEERRASPLPSRTLPGYIPGMNRPMTPRDFELDDRSHSTTPRATSPVMSTFQSDSLSSSLATPGSLSGAGLGRKESISAATVRQSPRPSTPSLFLQRTPSVNGRQTPEAQESIRRSGSGSGGDQPIEFESPLNSSLLARRRPISPLSNVAASASSSGNAAVVGNAISSRPSTPSNVIWQPSLSGTTGTMRSMHARNDSWTSDTSGSEIVVVPNGGASRGGQAPQRNVRSPSLPDSSTSGQNMFTAARVATPPPDRAQALMNGMMNNGGGDNRISDVFYSSSRSQRSPTPTQNTPRSPSSPAFGFTNSGSRRSSRQTATSPWGYTSASYAPPMFNLFGNNSRTSLGSTGSSYHSWEGDRDDREWYDQILSGEESQPAWHDLSVGRTDTPLSEDQAEELFRKYFGLTVAEVVTIQEKLVNFAGTKGDTARKRRPSTSQSNYVPPGRVNSPSPQVVQPAASPTTPNSPTSAIPLSLEQYNQKANALLDSVVSDIQAKLPPPPPPLDTASAAVRKSPASEPSPGTKRNHSLADVLFGPSDTRPTTSPQPDEPELAPDSSAIGTPIESHQGSVVNEEGSAQTLAESQTAESQAIAASATPSTTSSTTSSTQSRQLSHSVPGPMSPRDQTHLLQEYQVKIAQANATMKSASRTNLPGEGLSHSPSLSRKRIDASRISSPQLVAHSNPASLEALQTIPSRSPTLSTNNSGTSKIGSRFKKLRGTLRAKAPSSLTEEVTAPSSASSSSPVPTHVKSPVSSQTVNYDPAKLRAPGAPALASATEPGRSKVSLPSPPASAGPGLRGFISRFRGKQRATEPPSTSDKRLSPQLSAHPPSLSPLTPRHQGIPNVHNPTLPETGLNPPPVKPENPRQGPGSPPAPAESTPPSTHVISPSSGSRQSVMIQQLFDAANNLGLDKDALSDLLERSGSISSRPTRLARANSQTRSTSRQGQRNEAIVALEQSNSGDTSQLTIQPPSPTNSPPSQSTPDPGATRPLTFRPPEQARRARENHGDRAASTVVRRTIILPENFKAIKADSQSLQRANSGKRRRSSVNSGSLKDRAPTPPPPRSPVGQRFTDGGSPPVPSLPHTLNSDAYLVAPATRPNMNSMYDSSIYEMYANEGRMPATVGVDPHSAASTPGPGEPGPALELIEYANGDTIWSIVSGLRNDEDDEESIYNGRTSFASEYSTGTQGGQEWDNMQVTVKEQARSNSRGSYSSFALKSKKQAAQGKSRPETKVFYSSSTQIGQLIENLSQGMDSGSFNFAPSPTRPGHSAQSSLSTNDISMEDRLELLLGSLNRGS